MRAMVVLGLLLALPASAAVFEDVPPGDHWAADAVSRLVDAGVLEGRSDGLFHGEQGVTRYELAVALDRLRQAQGLPGIGLFSGLLGDLKSAADGADLKVGIKGGLPLGLLEGLVGQVQEQAAAGAGPAREQAQALLKELVEAVKSFRAEELQAARARLGRLADRLEAESDVLLKDLTGPKRAEAEKLLKGLGEELDQARQELRGKHEQRVEALLGELLEQGRELREQGLPRAGEKVDRMVEGLVAEGQRLWASPQAEKARGKLFNALTNLVMSGLMNQMKLPFGPPPVATPEAPTQD